MVFMRSTTTLEYFTLTRIDLRTFGSKVCDIILYIYIFCGINIVF